MVYTFTRQFKTGSMSFRKDIKTLYQMLFIKIRGTSAFDKMESLYAAQATHYDAFRTRLLKGRKQLYQKIKLPENGVLVELGGGTASNLEYFTDSIFTLKKITVVDASQSMLTIAGKRCEQNNWRHVTLIHDNAETVNIEKNSVDLVCCSYSLSMIENWKQALDNAFSMLKPGGKIMVIDFYVSAKNAAVNRRQHNRFTQKFWPLFFKKHGVIPSPGQLDYLTNRFKQEYVQETGLRMPYFPFIKAPYYSYIGKKS